MIFCELLLVFILKDYIILQKYLLWDTGDLDTFLKYTLRNSEITYA